MEQIPISKKLVQISLSITVPNAFDETTCYTINLLCDKRMSTKDVMSLAVAAVNAATGKAVEA